MDQGRQPSDPARNSHHPEPLRTFYVSPDGDDDNPGTEEEPWQTLAATSAKLEPGDLAIFEDGTYIETKPTVFNPGTAELPIVVQSRNGWTSVLRYEGRSNEGKVTLNAHVRLEWFEITQDEKGDDFNLGDSLVQCQPGADGCAVVGNKIHHTGGQCLWTGGTADVVFDQNNCYDATGWGAVTSFGTVDMIVSNNVFWETGNDTIYTKGGSRNTRIFNNIVYANDPSRWRIGISLGGSSDTHDPLDETREFVEDPSGWEAYNAVAWNNVIVAEIPGSVGEGLSIRGCHTCAFFNNLVVGADYGLSVTPGGGIDKGWDHETLTVDPKFKNNIFVDCREDGTSLSGVAGDVLIDYNLFHYCVDAPPQAHGSSSDPLFVNRQSDWQLRCGSPAIAGGAPVDWRTDTGESVDIATDMAGNRRGGRWDIGPYQFVASPSACAIGATGQGFAERATQRTNLLAGVGVSLAALAAVGYPLLTRRRRDQAQLSITPPQASQVAVYLDSVGHRPTVDLVVHNLGLVPAYDLTLSTTPDKPVHQGKQLSELAMFRHGIPYLAPGQTIRVHLGHVADLLPEPITVHAEFYRQRDGDQRVVVSDAFTIDARQFEGLATLPQSPDQEAAQALRQIADGMRDLRQGRFGGALGADLMTPFPAETHVTTTTGMEQAAPKPKSASNAPQPADEAPPHTNRSREDSAAAAPADPKVSTGEIAPRDGAKAVAQDDQPAPEEKAATEAPTPRRARNARRSAGTAPPKADDKRPSKKGKGRNHSSQGKGKGQ